MAMTGKRYAIGMCSLIWMPITQKSRHCNGSRKPNKMGLGGTTGAARHVILTTGQSNSVDDYNEEMNATRHRSHCKPPSIVCWIHLMGKEDSSSHVHGWEQYTAYSNRKGDRAMKLASLMQENRIIDLFREPDFSFTVGVILFMRGM